MDQIQSGNEWIIIDEIGPLEIRKEKGFHQLIVKIIAHNFDVKSKIIFVVRDFMVAEFLEKYKFENPKTLSKNNFIAKERCSKLIGITLCGGESKRMKTDKALLKYHGKEQWKIVTELLKPFCEEVVISINQNQWEKWAEKESDSVIIDHHQFKNHGPIPVF